jgi:hypothetical protein
VGSHHHSRKAKPDNDRKVYLVGLEVRREGLKGLRAWAEVRRRLEVIGIRYSSDEISGLVKAFYRGRKAPHRQLKRTGRHRTTFPPGDPNAGLGYDVVGDLEIHDRVAQLLREGHTLRQAGRIVKEEKVDYRNRGTSSILSIYKRIHLALHKRSVQKT